MATVGVKEAYRQGERAYLEGMDVNHCPGHYSGIEQDNWLEGYSNASRNNNELEDPSLSNSEDDYDDEDLEDLDFNT